MSLNVSSAYSSSDNGSCCSKATVLLADDIVFNNTTVEQVLTNTYGLRCDKVSDGQ